jgi:LacI family transcriptional regulator
MQAGGSAVALGAKESKSRGLFHVDRSFMGKQEPSTTIHDLARHLDVSSTTVWRALNNNPRISPATKERVLAAAKQFNYRPSLVAQTLSRGKTQTLGVVVPMIGNPVYATIIRAVEQVAFDHQYNIILCDTDFKIDRERAYIDLLLRRRIEGVVIIPFAKDLPLDFAHLLDIENQGVSVVTIQNNIPEDQLNRVVPDQRGAVRAIVEHMISLGHRRIGFFHGGVPEWSGPMRERHEGFRLALQAGGIMYQENHAVEIGSYESMLTDNPEDFDAERVRIEMRKSDRPTALFIGSDVLAIKVMEVIRDMGLRIPEDVAIAGFDDILMSAHTHPPLTTVRQPAAQIGHRATALLLELIDGKTIEEPVNERIPCELVIRASSGGRI